MIITQENGQKMIETQIGDTVIRTPYTDPSEIETPIQTPTLDDRLTGMENTLDLILLKQEGIL